MFLKMSHSLGNAGQLVRENRGDSPREPGHEWKGP